MTQALHFGFSYTPHGAHPGAWRLPQGRHDPFDPEQITAVARRAEEAGFTFIRFADTLAPDAKAGRHNPDALARTEVFTTASFLATRTRRIGFVAAGDTSYFEPFNLARLTSSLDHVTHGRAAWEATTGASRPAASNYSRPEASPEEHYARAAEVAEILRQLWDSWEDEAFIRNKATGEYVDGARIHPINHEGRLFRIKGPLNVARPPQGQLVVAHEITSDLSYDLAAAQADLVFLGAQPAAEIARRNETLAKALASKGRSPGSVRTFATVTPLVAATAAEAQGLLAELNSKAEGVAQSGGYLVGDPSQVADAIGAFADAAGVDGLVIQAPILTQQLDAFAELLAPELRRRGLLAPSEETTLRGQLGFERPVNRYAAA